ncbi:MAG: DUF6440 family protein [Lachnospiraceae bacterium]|jgi:hypothetical protein|nr:DUF6440 family protein [Lachnospiraceae bacterium]
MGASDRFEKVYGQGIVKTLEIWVDKETGINYLSYSNGGYAGGWTPLLDREGKPIVTPITK